MAELYAVAWTEDETLARYRFVEIGPRNTYLRPLFDAFEVDRLRVWTDAAVANDRLERSANEGLVTALLTCEGRQLAVVWSDFRVNGASYGQENSRRFTAFLRLLRERDEQIPLVYVVNSAGLSLMEGRTAFASAFGIWPELLRYSEDHVVLTCAVGKCLGLAPLLFGLGHYRVAVAGRTRINLTGPEVMGMFFGRQCGFEERTSAERCVELHDLVHEIFPSIDDALRRLRRILLLGSTGESCTGMPPDLGPRTSRILGPLLSEGAVELLPDWCPRVRVFLASRRGTVFGLFANPMDRADNLICVRTLEKYAAGLDLFAALGVPIVSALDSPGIDPRFDEGDAGLIRQILEVGERIIRYPHGSLGIVAGRCFGGATTLVFPRAFRGDRTIAIRDARIGVMDEKIVDRLLAGSPRLLALWTETKAHQDPAFRDLINVGSLDRVVDPEDLPSEIDRFLGLMSVTAHTLPLRPRVVR